MFAIAFLLIPKSPQIYALVVLILIAIGWVAGPPVIKEFSTIFATGEERDASAESRFTLWRAAIMVAIDNPILGVGPYLGQYSIPRYEISLRQYINKHPHNIFFEMLSGCGFPALFSYVSLFFISCVKAYKLRKEFFSKTDRELLFATLLPMIGLPALAVAGMFCGSGMMESLYYLVGISIAGLVSYERQNEQRAEDEYDDGHDDEFGDEDSDENSDSLGEESRFRESVIL
jgi:O-antigen ligase